MFGKRQDIEFLKASARRKGYLTPEEILSIYPEPEKKLDEIFGKKEEAKAEVKEEPKKEAPKKVEAPKEKPKEEKKVEVKKEVDKKEVKPEEK